MEIAHHKEVPCRIVSFKLDEHDADPKVTTFKILDDKTGKPLKKATFWLSVLANNEEKYEEIVKTSKLPFPYAISKRRFILREEEEPIDRDRNS